MESIIPFLHSAISYVIPFVILLGLLIFVHELGHFSVAKFFGIRVETFSLGFWKKIIQFKRGDTTYCVSIIPLGGYVKMFGDDPTMNVTEDQKRYSFLHKPVSQRIAVVLAGPLMNFFFAIFLFFIVAMMGEDMPKAQVGDVAESTKAYALGFRSGDEIISVNNEAIKTWPEVDTLIKSSVDRELKFKIKREGDGSELEISATPEWAPTKDILSTDSHEGAIDGLTLFSDAAILGISSGDSLLAKAGLPSLALISKVNNVEVHYFRQIAPALLKAMQSGQPIRVEFKAPNDRGDYSIDGQVLLTPELYSGVSTLPENELLKGLGAEETQLYVSSVSPDSPAAQQGLQSGDRFVAINGKIMTKWDEVVEMVKGYKEGSNPIEFKILRREGEKVFNVVPKMTSLMTPQGQEEKRYTIGVKPAIGSAIPEVINVSLSNPFAAFWKGCTDSIKWSKVVIVSFLKLIQNEVSAKNIGGVISIGEVAGRSFQEGLSAYIKIMAILSINLFIINLLPVPILDGGHLVFFTYEALRGAPLSMRKMEIAQQVGLIILMSLMIFALFNDVTRYLSL